MNKPAANTIHDLDTLFQALADSGLLSDQDLTRVLAGKARCTGEHPLEYLDSLGLEEAVSGQPLGLERLCQWLAAHCGLPFYTIDPLTIDVHGVTSVMSRAYAQRHGILAVEVCDRYIRVASASPWQSSWEDNLRHVNRRDIRPVIASPADIRRYTHEFYRLAQCVEGASAQQEAQPGIGNLEQMLEIGNRQNLEANDQHIVNIVDWMLQYAFEQRAGDIHIEPRRDHCPLRFRIDGLLHLIYRLPPGVAAAVISRFKILGRMNVAEKRKPQDGRLKTCTPEGIETELRLSTLPTVFGEKLVLRIFDPQVLVRSYRELGFSADDESRWQAMTRQPHGLTLVTGPTGSGKTCSLYSTLKSLADTTVNICTLEDPIEQVEPAFNQMQVQPGIQLDFAAGMRALLRQDPDIIMVGEIRDGHTAQMAVQAALTGHSVFSSLHTQDAPSAVIRMLELGIPPYLLKATLTGVMAQRLVRTLCHQCKVAVTVQPADWAPLATTMARPAQIYRPQGCSLCRHTGYRGRTGIHEIMAMTPALGDLLAGPLDSQQLRQQALESGMISLRQAGASLVAQGLTTIEEVLRVTPDSPKKTPRTQPQGH